MAGVRLAFLIALLAGGAIAQTKPSIKGRVLDQTGAPIAGAQIETRDGAAVRSDERGRFLLPAEPGANTLEVSADGFAGLSRGLMVPEGGLVLDDLILAIAPFRATVSVTESAYQADAVRSGSKTLTALRDLPQSISVVTRDLMNDQMMTSIGDVVRYVPGVTAIQGENNRDQVVIRGNSSSADFYWNGVRDDVQYYRDLYNLEDVEALKGPNAMVFGRGGGGGVINRVTKEAGFTPLREITLTAASYRDRRVTADLNEALGARTAVRLNGMFEDGDSFRQHVGLRRMALNPTVTIMAAAQTKVALSYEHLRDDRTADRGTPSFDGKPLEIDRSTYFGNPRDSHAGARVNIGSAAVEQQFGALNLHNRTLIGDYDRGYQNFVPGAVTADGLQVALSAYNNATVRRNLFNQTDLTYSLSTGRIRHTVSGGAEVGSQLSRNFRNTGYFLNTATAILAPLADPVIATSVSWRQNATDADNRVRALAAATYVQDQIAVTSRVQLIAGARFDHFDLRFHNNRSGDDLRRIDNMISPRAGVVAKLWAPLSVYANYSVSFLPSSGDQFSSLTTITQQLKPEKFANYELGTKWDATRRLSLTFAAYRLDRSNTRATDPNDPTRIVQTGSQRTNGYEAGWNGSVTRAWKIAGGYAWQDAYVSSATAVARVGARVAQVPRHTFSLWNQYQVLARLGVGLGILNRTDMFAAIDNTVVLPGYVRADAAVFFSMTERIRLQANVENVFDRRYFLNADNNTNLSPGSPKAVRIGMTARF